MSTVAQLSKEAAKLLLLFIQTNGESLPVPQAMVEAGISRSGYYRGRSQLQKFGYIDRKGNLTWQPVVGTVSKPETVEGTGGLTFEQAAEGLRLGFEAMPKMADFIGPSLDPEPQTVRQRAMQADLMDDSGDWSSSNSPRRKRRLAQIKVVQDAWDEAFGESLTPENAKDFLGWNDDSAEAVLEVIEDAKRRVATGYVKSPLAWLRTKFIKRAKEPPQVKQAAVGQPVDEGILMADFTPATKAKQARIEAALAKRKRTNDGWDDDD